MIVTRSVETQFCRCCRNGVIYYVMNPDWPNGIMRFKEPRKCYNCKGLGQITYRKTVTIERAI